MQLGRGSDAATVHLHPNKAKCYYQRTGDGWTKGQTDRRMDGETNKHKDANKKTSFDMWNNIPQ